MRKYLIYILGSQAKTQRYDVTEKKDLREMVTKDKNQVRTFLKKYGKQDILRNSKNSNDLNQK